MPTKKTYNESVFPLELTRRRRIQRINESGNRFLGSGSNRGNRITFTVLELFLLASVPVRYWTEITAHSAVNLGLRSTFRHDLLSSWVIYFMLFPVF